MPDVTGWSEDELLDYENGLAAQEFLSSPRQEAYLDAYRVAAMRAIDEGLGSQWLRDEERRLRNLDLEELVAYAAEGQVDDDVVHAESDLTSDYREDLLSDETLAALAARGIARRNVLFAAHWPSPEWMCGSEPPEAGAPRSVDDFVRGARAMVSGHVNQLTVHVKEDLSEFYDVAFYLRGDCGDGGGEDGVVLPGESGGCGNGERSALDAIGSVDDVAEHEVAPLSVVTVEDVMNGGAQERVVGAPVGADACDAHGQSGAAGRERGGVEVRHSVSSSVGSGSPDAAAGSGAGNPTEEASVGSVGIDRRALLAGRCSR